MVTLAQLPAEWRKEAERLRNRYRQEDLAALAETHAVELERAIQLTQLEPLTLVDASAESGYSVGHLRRLVRDGTIPNAGDDSEDGIRILRRYLPRKPGANVATEAVRDASSRTQVARAVAQGG